MLLINRILQASGRTIRSFNADSDVNDIINEAGIKKGGLSDWINDKIKKGLIYDKHPTTVINSSKGEIIGVEID